MRPEVAVRSAAVAFLAHPFWRIHHDGDCEAVVLASMFDQPLSVFTGNFEIVTKFKVPADTTSGPAIIAGKLRYQACNNNMCFPPKTVDVKLAVEIQ